jgi:hypothetical protein
MMMMIIIMNVEQSVKCLAGETKVFVKYLPQYRFIHHKSHMTSPGLEPRPLLWEAGD